MVQTASGTMLILFFHSVKVLPRCCQIVPPWRSILSGILQTAYLVKVVDAKSMMRMKWLKDLLVSHVSGPWTIHILNIVIAFSSLLPHSVYVELNKKTRDKIFLKGSIEYIVMMWKSSHFRRRRQCILQTFESILKISFIFIAMGKIYV